MTDINAFDRLRMMFAVTAGRLTNAELDRVWSRDGAKFNPARLAAFDSVYAGLIRQPFALIERLERAAILNDCFGNCPISIHESLRPPETFTVIKRNNLKTEL